MTLPDIAIAAVMVSLSIALAVVLAVWLSSRRTDELRVAMAAKIGRLESIVIDMQVRREARPATGPAAAAQPPPTAARRDEQEAWREADPYQDLPPEPPAPPAGSTLEQFSQAAAAALQGQQAFREFAAASGGAGFMVRPAPEWAEPAPGPHPDMAADLWVVDDGGSRLVYPGYNLRRSQSALVADAGRLARERLEWLFDIVPGPQLGATRPARIARGDWTIVERGVLAIPLRAG